MPAALPVLDPIQLKRIEAVHRGFLYQHFYAAGCLMLAAGAGARACRSGAAACGFRLAISRRGYRTSDRAPRTNFTKVL